jgi:hypothetical protein
MNPAAAPLRSPVDQRPRDARLFSGNPAGRLGV